MYMGIFSKEMLLSRRKSFKRFGRADLSRLDGRASSTIRISNRERGEFFTFSTFATFVSSSMQDSLVRIMSIISVKCLPFRLHPHPLLISRLQSRPVYCFLS